MGRRVWTLLGCVLLAGCASQSGPTGADASSVASSVASSTISSSPWAAAGTDSGHGAGGWQHYPLPGKTQTRYRYQKEGGRESLAVIANSAASMLRHKVRLEPDELGAVRFSWKVPELMAQADMALREADDSPVRIILAFEGDRSRFSQRDALLSELARTITGEEMPYATLMYVWCNKREPGTVIRSARTGRIRKLVLESGPSRLGRWLDYERDIRADFLEAFGEEPGALVGIAIMTDSDNTRSTARAWYGPVSLLPKAAVTH